MRRPGGPLLGLAFYAPTCGGESLLHRLFTHYIAHGARVEGSTLLLLNPNAKRQTFASIHDLPYVEETEITTSAIEMYFDDPNAQVLEVALSGASGICNDSYDIVTQLSINEKSVGRDVHPVVVWVDGSIFSGPYGEDYGEIAYTKGLATYLHFVELISVLNPAYASITVAYDLDCPSDLEEDPRTLAFEDFYVSRSFASESQIRALCSIFDKAYQEPVGDGVYISSSPFFNPNRMSIDSAAAGYLSIRAGEIILACAKRLRHVQ